MLSIFSKRRDAESRSRVVVLLLSNMGPVKRVMSLCIFMLRTFLMVLTSTLADTC